MSTLMKRPKTMADIYRLLPEGTPVQLINNHFYMSPAPRFDHFSVTKEIMLLLHNYVSTQKLGIVVFAPVDVFLGDKNAVQPDIFYISSENENLIKEDGVYGPPDLIVEILSPRNKNTDLVKKKALYEEFGVKEYFIVDPSDKSIITWHLHEGKYAEQKKQSGKLVSKILNKSFSFK